MINPAVFIDDQGIGESFPVYVVAEMSANHLQSLDRAIQIIHAAKKSGADAIKLQTYTPDSITLNSSLPHFQIQGNQWEGETLHSLYKKTYMPYEWHEVLIKEAQNLDITLFSSPFDIHAVQFLETLNMPAYKIASFENVDIPLLKAVAQTGKPVIISTGMANLAEIDEAVQTLRTAGNKELILLHCTSAYPARVEDANLRCIPHLAETFSALSGLSDHTLGITVPIASVMLGACFIEKHLTLSRADGGPDANFSLEPHEFEDMVKSVHLTKKALGQLDYSKRSSEASNRAYRRSLFVVRDIKSGESFDERNVRSIRPGTGLHTRYYDKVLGKLARHDIPAGTPLSWELVGL